MSIPYGSWPKQVSPACCFFEVMVSLPQSDHEALTLTVSSEQWMFKHVFYVGVYITYMKYKA